MNPRVWSLPDLITTNLADLQAAGGALHEHGHDLPPDRLHALANGATPTSAELDALAWLGLPVQNTPEWLLNDERPGKNAGA